MPEKPSAPDLENLAKRPRAASAKGPAGLEEIHRRALLAARAAVDLKAEDVKILDMHDLVSYTDFLVVATGRNTRLTRRIMEDIGFKMKQEYGLLPAGTEGGSNGDWILMDYLDFVVHVFTPEAREFYRLDVLWKQAAAEDVE